MCAACQLSGGGMGALMWMMPLHLYVNQKHDDDDDDDDDDEEMHNSLSLYPPQTLFVVGYTVIMSVRPSVRVSVCP